MQARERPAQPGLRSPVSPSGAGTWLRTHYWRIALLLPVFVGIGILLWNARNSPVPSVEATHGKLPTDAPTAASEVVDGVPPMASPTASAAPASRKDTRYATMPVVDAPDVDGLGPEAQARRLEVKSRGVRAQILDKRLEAHLTELRQKMVTSEGSEREDLQRDIALLEKNLMLRRSLEGSGDLLAARPGAR
jgi:hypothetical protein